MAKNSSTHPVNEVLPFGQLFIYGLQHVLAMYAGAVTVPIVIGAAFQLSSDQVIFLISADLFTCGIATLIQTLGFWKFGIRIPVIQGVTFACVQPIIALGTGIESIGGSPEQALVVVFTSVAMAGLFAIIIAPLFSKLIRFFPPVVTGTVILAIGLSLLGVAVKMCGGQNFSAYGQYGAPAFLLVALSVVLTILIGNRFLKGFLKNISVLLGMIVGLIVCIPFGFVDFSKVATASWIGIDLPLGLNMPGLSDGSYFALLQTDIFAAHIIPAIISMLVVMVIVMVESTGDYIAIGEVIDLDIGEKEIARGLRADGLSTLLGGCLNALPYTAFAQNVGLVALTRVRSRFVVACSGGILILLGLVPKLAAVFDSLPPMVIGGAAFVMFGTVAANGIKTLSKADLDSKPNNIFIVAIAIAVGLIPTVGALTSSVASSIVVSGTDPYVVGHLITSVNLFDQVPAAVGPLVSSGISLTAITAIILNIFFNGIKRDTPAVTDGGASPEPLIDLQAAMAEGVDEDATQDGDDQN
jgi:xanthine permease